MKLDGTTGAATFSSSVTQPYGIFTGVTPAYPTSGQGIIDGNGGNLRLFAYADINFYTNSSQNMVIKSGGNVGIAETSPASKLSIGGVQGSTIGSNVALLVGNNGAAGTVGNMIQIGLHYNPAGATPASVIGAVFTSTTGYTKSDIFFATRDVTTDTAPTERMRITSGGNVLIGTTTDAGYKLDVNGTGRINGSLQVGSGSGGSGTATQSVFQDTYGGLRSAIYVKNTADYATGRGSGYSIQNGNGVEKAWFQIQANDATQTGYSLILGNSGGSLSIASSGAATFSSTIKTAGFGSTTAQPWKLGQLVTATVIGVNTTGYLTVEVNGSQYNLALANLA